MVWWFAETTLMASALAAVAALAGRVRPIGPTARHLLWLAVLVRLMTPPLVAWPWAVARDDLRWPAAPRQAVPSSDPGPDRTLATAPMADAVPAVAIEPVEPPAPVEPETAPAIPAAPVGAEEILLGAWLAGAILLGTVQAGRILRFRRRLRLAVPAPEDLVDEAGRLRGRVPEVLVVPGLGSPMLWCLGRPRLLLPAALVRRLDRDRWRGILAHELAHLRRGDHWVSRLELLAGLVWWWNPLYWLTRARLDAEAELACDAWVVQALPDDRLAYAEALFDIGSALSRADTPAPALGAAGTGRFLERRLVMILRERVPCRVSPLVVLAAIVLVALAAPSWSSVTAVDEPQAPDATPAPPAPPAPPAAPAPPAITVDDDHDADDADEDDDDDDAARVKAKARQAAERARQAAARARARAEAKSAKPDAKGRKKGSDDEIQVNLGPDFEKKMAEIGERIGKEMEAKFGPGSDFEKQMKQLGEKAKDKAGTDSKAGEDRLDWAKRMYEKGYLSKRVFDEEVARARAARGAKPGTTPAPKASAKKGRREARIAALEAQIRKLADELKALQAEDDEDDDR